MMSILTLAVYRFFTRYDLQIMLFIFCILTFPMLAHDNATRWSTVTYSILFCLSFLSFIRAYISSSISPDDFIITLQILIYSYFVVLFIQQVSVLAGVAPINLRNYDVYEPFKLNSLGAEPSWSGRIVALLFYCYLTVRETKLGRAYSLSKDVRQDKWIWLAFLWTMITMISGTAIVFLSIVFVKFARLKSILIVIIIAMISLTTLESVKFEPYERAKNVLIATISLDERKVIEADHSASFRVVPLMVLAKSVGVSKFEDYFGHGVDSISEDLEFNLGPKATSSSFFGVWYEYGFIAFIIFMVCSIRMTVNSIPSFIFWFFLVFMTGLNIQLPWLAMMCLYICKDMEKKYKGKAIF